ncbi:bifunctional DNA primase/polymerase [Streptomyces sp. NPDC001941]|uniref:bifunctional DNA primase/polymerase n=1 Tax=Streptomyces sp. NPDC001941 TaxID=3154659 RepID=UPI0033253708
MTPDQNVRRTSLLDSALTAAARGWPVFPLRPGSKRPALHGEAACPRTGPCAAGHAKWEQRATTDPDRIRAAWSTGAFNIGIATGPAGLVVVDLDQARDKDSEDAPDGATNFLALCERAGTPVPRTYTVRTPSGGHHLYFTAPVGSRLANTQDTLAPSIDTRAWGGYVVAPDSTTPTGAYTLTDPTPPVPLPAWLRQALAPAPAPRTAGALRAPRDASRVASVALVRERDSITSTPEGGRERRLFEAARAMGRFVAWGDIPRHVVEEAFQGAGEAAGLKAHECRSTLRSALNWSIRTARPREAQ